MLERADAAAAALFARIKSLSGWRRGLAAFAAGCGAALSFAPVYATPMLAIGYSALVLLIDACTNSEHPRRSAFAAGWFFGFGYFLVGVYWMSFSFFVQADQFAWMAPFVVLGMPAFLALFWGAASALSAHFWRTGWRRIFVFAAVISIVEFSRGHVLTGLPWNLPAQALAGGAEGAQTAAWLGAYGLSFVVILLAAFPSAFTENRRALWGLVATLSGAALLFAVGAARLAGPEPKDQNVFVRIVQPNIPQREKIDPAYWGRNFRRNLELSQGDAPGPLYVIWPENAAALVGESREALDAVSSALSQDAILIAGSVRREADASGRYAYYNAISVIAETSAGRRTVAHYDKHHLVPFGEYLPFQGALRAIGLAQLAPYDDGFTAGPGPRVLRVGPNSFSPLICYEAIFPGEMHPRGERPDWLVTVTNDAWFGDTSGPRQHLDQARLRSIETGLPMARSANTGISALIDSKGRLLQRIPLYEEGRIDARLPGAGKPTLYSKTGDTVFLLLVLVALGVGRSNLRARAAQ